MAARILIIEDNHANLELMRYLLQSFGHIPITARDGLTGLDAARREKPDLIVCDLQLPKMGGYEVAQSLRTDPSLRAIPLVAVTAYAMVGDREKALQAGFDGYVPKPIEAEKFIKQLDVFLQPSLRGAVDTQPAVAQATAAASPPPNVRGVILSVDNAPANLSLNQCMLEPFGFAVVTARSVGEALKLARESPPDLILSDLHMPGRNGYELLNAIKIDPRLRTIPFILISSSSSRHEEPKECVPAQVRRFLRRPVDPEVLVAEIENCLKALRRQHGDHPGS